MAWCPQCKEEYEDHVKVCAECHVPLVDDLESVSYERILLIVNNEDEAKKGQEYLKYSGIGSVSVKESDNEQGEPVFILSVDEEDWEKATKIMQGYTLTEKKEPDKEEFYFDEYQTMNIQGDDALSELKSSYVSFVVMGAIVLGVGLINVLGVASFLRGNLPFMFVIIGAAFVGIGIYTRSSMETKKEAIKKTKDEFDKLYTWYNSQYSIDEFFNRNDLVFEDIDEGAKYFVLMDDIVKELKTNGFTENDLMINTVAEKIYNELLNE